MCVGRISAPLMAAALLVTSACGSGGDDSGSGGFESAGGFGDDDGGGGLDFGGAPGSSDFVTGNAAGDASATGAPGPAPREVEESDIYRFSGARLYVLNQYRGLFVFDVSDADHPLELGRLALFGTPIEMYVRDDRVFVILGDYLEPYEADGFPEGTLRRERSSRVVAIDVGDPEDPRSLGDIALDGYVADSRLVGDVIYAVAGITESYDEEIVFDECDRAGDGAVLVGGGPAPGTPIGGPLPGIAPGTTGGNYFGPAQRMVVTSIDISDPSAVHEVEQLEVDAGGVFVHATDEAFVIAGLDYDSPSGPSTRITYVDISDPDGAMEPRGGLTLSGEIQDDTALDMHAGQLRVLTRDWSRGVTKVRIFDASDPDALPMLGELDYVYEGDVFGTTFDGDRLYMIHYFQIDPLEVVDLSDPTQPRVAGILEMPGWVDRIAAMGDRLIGLGIDDQGPENLVSLSLFDVADPNAPQLLDRISTGDGWSSTPATAERKAWSVDREQGLIVFPYSSYSP